MKQLETKIKKKNVGGEDIVIQLPCIRRETLSRVTTGKHAGKSLIVELFFPDKIQIRIKGTQQKFEVDAHSIYWWLCHGRQQREISKVLRKSKRTQNLSRK